MARASLARALQLAPTHAGAKLALARLGLQEGKTDEALRLGREMSKEHPELVDGVLVEAQALARQKRLPEALKLLEQAQTAQPASDRVTFALANLRWTSGDKEGRLRTVAQWEEQHPDDVAATMRAAQAYLSFGREAQAAEAYEKALKLAPSNPMVLNNMAWLVQKTDPKRALELAEKAHALKPSDAGITTRWAGYSCSNSRLRAAWNCYKKRTNSPPGVLPSIITTRSRWRNRDNRKGRAGSWKACWDRRKALLRKPRRGRCFGSFDVGSALRGPDHGGVAQDLRAG
jgi:tetratricopeptide (TPR) repeat protein